MIAKSKVLQKSQIPFVESRIPFNNHIGQAVETKKKTSFILSLSSSISSSIALSITIYFLFLLTNQSTKDMEPTVFCNALVMRIIEFSALGTHLQHFWQSSPFPVVFLYFLQVLTVSCSFSIFRVGAHCRQVETKFSF